jgi:acyl carrier protein
VSLSKDECTSLIREVYRQFAPAEPVREITAETRLFGGDSAMDSTALVSLLVEVEQQINDACGADIVIADERAMSQKRSPFRSIGSLGEYVHALLAEQGHAA